jgi:addiction module RelE/StbE family toxin
VIVTFADEAAAELEAIGDYIAQDNPGRAASFVEEIVERCERLGQRPYAFALVPRYAHLGIRKWTFGNYLIFYRVTGNVVEVLHVVNAARDYDTILGGD